MKNQYWGLDNPFAKLYQIQPLWRLQMYMTYREKSIDIKTYNYQLYWDKAFERRQDFRKKLIKIIGFKGYWWNLVVEKLLPQWNESETLRGQNHNSIVMV